MQRCCGVLIVFSLLISLPSALAQTQGSQAPKETETASQIPPETPVITIEGLCADELVVGRDMPTASTASPASTPTGTPDKTACKTVITRAEFETLLYSMDPVGSDRAKTMLISRYPDMILFAKKARDLGLDKDPRVQAKIKYQYLENLDLALMARMKDEAFGVPEPVLEKFYREHPDRFVFIELLRIDVPKQKQHPDASGSAGAAKVDPAAEEREMEKVARAIRREAIAGGSFEKLEAKAYKLAGETDDPPDTDLGDKWTIDTLPKEFARTIFDLKPGQVSPLIDTSQAFMIYKLVSKQKIPWSEAKSRAATLMDLDSAQVIRESVKTELNSQYFSIPASATVKEDGKAEGK
jgi:hypothetical protein